MFQPKKWGNSFEFLQPCVTGFQTSGDFIMREVKGIGDAVCLAGTEKVRDRSPLATPSPSVNGLKLRV
jgi:hypothetical protein